MAFKLFILYLAMVFLRPIEQFAPDLMALRPMLLLWAATFLSSVAYCKKTGLFAAHGMQIRMLLLFWLAIVLSLIFNAQWARITDAIGEFSTPAMLMFLVVMNVTDLRRFKITCGVLLWSVFILCLQSIHSYETGYMIETFVIRQVAVENSVIPQGLTLPSDDVTGVFLWRMRSVGFLQDPNDFSQVICMVIPWLWLGYREGAWFMNMIRVVMPAAVMLYAIHLTHSRGGLVGIAVIFAMQMFRKIGGFWTSIFALGGAVGMQILSQMGGRGFNAKEASANERLDAWFSGIEMFKSHPLFGVGYGGFMEHHIRTAHNSFVLCFAELGTFGFVCWLSLIVMAVQCVFHVARQGGGEKQWLGWMMCSSLGAFLACAWFLSRTYQASLFMLFGLCYACYFVVKRDDFITEGRGAKMPRPDLPARWLGVTLACYAVSMIGVSFFVRAAK